MHICVVNLDIEYYAPSNGGAIATVIMESSRELERRGHRISVVTRVDGAPTYDVGDIVKMEVFGRSDLNIVKRLASRVEVKARRWQRPYYRYHFREIVRAIQSLESPPDAIIVHNDVVAPYLLKQVLPGVHIAVWLHNELPASSFSRSSRMLSAPDSVFVVSDHLAIWARRYGYTPGQLTVVRNGVNLCTFHPREGWRERSYPVRVLFLGRINPDKGPHLVIDACSVLRDEGYDLQLTVVGGTWWYGPDEDPYFLSQRERALATGARWMGHVERDRVPSIVRDHDILCLPSLSPEGYPLVIGEAQAAALAIITSDRGGQAEAGGRAALLVRPEDPRTVVEALRSLVRDPTALYDAKTRARAEAERSTWEQVAVTVERRLLSHGPRRSR